MHPNDARRLRIQVHGIQHRGRQNGNGRRRPGAAAFALAYLLEGGWVSVGAAELMGTLLELGRSTLASSEAGAALGITRHGLAKRCRTASLPPPADILALGRLLHASEELRRCPSPLRVAAKASGYPDPYTLSAHMHRYTGIRPSDGPDWRELVAAWADRCFG